MTQLIYNKDSYKGKYSSFEESCVANRTTQMTYTARNREKIREQTHAYYILKIKPMKEAKRKQDILDKIERQKLGLEEPDKLSYYMRVIKPKNELKKIVICN
jgi:ATPase subunit of ABC transporter with duplicated ATPase domains